MAFEIKNFPGKLIFKSIAPKNVGKLQIQDNGSGISPQELENLKLELFKMRSRDVRNAYERDEIGGLVYKKCLYKIVSYLWKSYAF